MILERLVLENFRQFKGRQELIFSDSRKRNVTIVHAENGFGKTTILKALLWVLYGPDGLLGPDGREDDFERPGDIIHDGLIYKNSDPKSIIARVQLTFMHAGSRYVVTRQISLADQRIDPTKHTIMTLEQMVDGETRNLERARERIKAIIPQGISNLLFFNGERINYLAMEKNSEKITEAIRQMLGLSLLQTTIDDLRHQSVKGRFRNEQKEASSDEKRELISRHIAEEEKREKLKEQLAQTKLNLKSTLADMEAIDAKLEANREAHQLQLKRTKILAELNILVDDQGLLSRRLSKIVAEDGYSVFTRPLLIKGKEIVSRLRSEGKIPARVLNTFLQELLDSGNCICKRCLAEGSPERAAVESLLTIAGDQNFNNAVGSLDHAIGLIEGSCTQTGDSLSQLNSERLRLANRIRVLNEEKEEIHHALGDKDDEEVQHLESKRRELELRADGLKVDSGRLQQQIDTAEESARLLSQQISQLEDKEAAAELAQRRIDAVEACADILENILAAETEDLRPLLNFEIDKYFQKIIDRDFWAELTPDYTLKIRKNVSGAIDHVQTDVGLSTGQRTVTSLIFIASLVALANRRSEIPTILQGASGSSYPIAIDSPFGSLSIFREGVATYIPELAPQVLLLVSPEQYDGQVEAALKDSDRVGKRYYLVHHSPDNPGKKRPQLKINGEVFEQYASSFDEEFTSIEAISS